MNLRKFLLTLTSIPLILVFAASCATDSPGGEITIELYPGKAPITVENFISLVNDGFYDGLNFHRIVPDFMIQGGCSEGTGGGGSDDMIFGEFLNNGWDGNADLSHERGVISMARMGHDMDSASSQFFICVGDASFLDGDYAAFGRVLEGMDVVDRIVNGPADGETALEPEIMDRVTVEGNIVTIRMR